MFSLKCWLGVNHPVCTMVIVFKRFYVLLPEIDALQMVWQNVHMVNVECLCVHSNVFECDVILSNCTNIWRIILCFSYVTQTTSLVFMCVFWQTLACFNTFPHICPHHGNTHAIQSIGSFKSVALVLLLVKS